MTRTQRQRWRCTNPTCGITFTRTRTDRHDDAVFHAFLRYILGKETMTELAATRGISRSTLHRQFQPLWLITTATTDNPHQVEDQIFLDGTYMAAGCLLIAATKNHIITWAWAHRESKDSYRNLIKTIPTPTMAVIDGGQGAYSAIKECWPGTVIQRCLVHVQRVVRRHTTSRPKTEPGRAILRLSQKLTTINDYDQARTWITQLHEYGQVYQQFLNQRSYNPDTRRHDFTHKRVRAAYQSLISLTQRRLLFAYLDPPTPSHRRHYVWASTTNPLEGGFNAQIKTLLRHHRGQSLEHTRTMVDWWCYLHTNSPEDPLTIARRQHFGRDRLTQGLTLIQEDTSTDTIGPAYYDTAIPDTYEHSIGIRHGPLR